MDLMWKGRIAGEFHGYRYGAAHELSDGTRWRQEGRAEEAVYRERPGAKLLRDPNSGKAFLDVEGTSGVVEVVPDRPGPWSGSWGPTDGRADEPRTVASHRPRPHPPGVSSSGGGRGPGREDRGVGVPPPV